MKRVLLTVHKFFPEHKAGTEVLTLKVAQELQKRGKEVLVVTASPPDLDARHKVGEYFKDIEVEGVNVHVIGEPVRLEGYTFAHEYKHPGMAAHFKSIFASFKPDILHIFHAQNHSASIIDIAQEFGIPKVASTTDFWFVCPIVQLKRADGNNCRGPGPFAVPCLNCYTPKLLPSLNQFKTAIKERFSGIENNLEKLPGGLEELSWQVLQGGFVASKLSQAVTATINRPKYLIDKANDLDAIMVPTRLMREIFIENGINSELIHQVPFGIDTKIVENHTKKTPSQELRIGYIGTLFEHKGVDTLIEAFQLLDTNAKANLTIYGNLNQFPDYGQYLENLVQSHPASRNKIRFAGTFANEKIGQVLENIDILVVPSRWYENTPLVIQTALAAKTPLIATDLGGMSEIIKDGHNGLLFPVNDSQALSKCFQLLMKKPELLQKFAENIAPERTTSDMVDDIEKIYEQVRSKS